jgi:hypothetical protein
MKTNIFLFVATIGIVVTFTVACNSSRKITVVLNNLEENICVLKLDTNSELKKDTVYLSEDGIGVLNYSDPYRLNGNLFEVIYFDEKGKKVKLEEWIPNRKYKKSNQIYFQHGLFTSVEETGFLVFFVGNLDYLRKDFDIEDSTYNTKIDKAVNF